MTNDYFILDENKSVIETDLMTWAKWYQNADRRVQRTETHNGTVGTVFLGLNHNFDDAGPPLIFETLVFGGSLDGEMDRYTTWKQAEDGHAAMVARVKSAPEIPHAHGGPY